MKNIRKIQDIFIKKALVFTRASLVNNIDYLTNSTITF